MIHAHCMKGCQSTCSGRHGALLGKICYRNHSSSDLQQVFCRLLCDSMLARRHGDAAPSTDVTGEWSPLDTQKQQETFYLDVLLLHTSSSTAHCVCTSLLPTLTPLMLTQMELKPHEPWTCLRQYCT